MKEYIIGNKIILRKLEQTDYISFYNEVISIKDQDNYYYTSDEENYKKFFNSFILFNNNNYFYVICVKEKKQIIGYVNVSQNIIYLNEEYRTNDILNNIIKLLCNLFFNELKCDELSFNVNNKNSFLISTLDNNHFIKQEDNYKLKRSDYKLENKLKHKYLTGEDIDMFNERTYTNRKNICDNHWDGA